MSKIILTADVHAGVPGRLQDILWSCRVIDEWCYRNDIDTAFVLGDLLTDRKSLELDVACGIYDFLTNSKKRGLNWYTFPGNHDMFLKHSWEINSLRPLSGVLNVIEQVKLLELDSRRFWVLPFIHFEHSYMRVLERIEKQYKPGDTMLTHIGVRGSTLNSCFLLQDWSVVDFTQSPFQRVYTGHFHVNQQVGSNVWYPGSPIPFKFDEGDVPHGFYELDLETMEHKFINIWEAGAEFFPNEPMPSQFHTVLNEQIDNLNQDDVSGQMVRIMQFEDMASDKQLEIKKHLLSLGAKGVTWVRKHEKTQTAVIPSKIVNADPADMFMRWYEADSNAKNLDRGLLVRLDAEIRHEGDERYIYDIEPD